MDVNASKLDPLLKKMSRLEIVHLMRLTAIRVNVHNIIKRDHTIDSGGITPTGSWQTPAEILAKFRESAGAEKQSSHDWVVYFCFKK
jgi:hypothetical protein